MNPSPSPQPNGPKRDPPPTGAQPLQRTKPRSADPLVARKKRGPKPPLSRLPPKASPASAQSSVGASPRMTASHPSLGSGPSNKELERLRAFEARRVANGGWSQNPPVKDYKEFPLLTTKRALREGLRYHIMRFNRGKDDTPIDPTDQEQFPRPVSLHRRDPRMPPAGRLVVKDEEVPSNPADEAEAERLRQLKAEREAQRAVDMAQIAPVAKQNEPKPTKQPKKDKAVSTYRATETQASKKQQELRYEETLPWHLEDVEGKNVWVGSYVAALSEVNVALVISGGGFRMIPLERYYKFNAKPAFQRFSLEEAERMMGKNASGVGRWVMRDKERAEADKEVADYRKYLGGPARVKIENLQGIPKSEKVDDQDLDMSGEEFQDDDEAPGFEADDEDTRDARVRMRRDHLGANNFGEVEEEDVDKEEEMEKLQKLRDKIQGKRTRKNLAKLERAMEYSSESDSDNPFAESSSESDSEKEKEESKDEDAKNKTDEKDKLASGANTKGNTTPSGKHKATELLKKPKSLKRPGSPNLSESSGNESSRKKKMKKVVASGSVSASRSSTPLPARSKMAGATSDGEATAGEGSDGGLKAKKIKLKTGTGAKGTPAGSRAGSPVPAGNKLVSPAKADTPGGSPPPGSPTGPVQPWEIVQALESRPEGISLGELLRMFSHRVESEKYPHLMKRQEWIALVRQNATYGPDKLVRPKAKPST